MHLDDMIASWRETKKRFTSMRLVSPSTQEFEFLGRQLGHPSTYAYVRFECEPADALTFASRARWPSTLADDDRRRLVASMTSALVDVLVATQVARLGCAITCTDIRWDDVASSEAAFYRATHEAMSALRDGERWEYVRRSARGPRARRARSAR